MPSDQQFSRRSVLRAGAAVAAGAGVAGVVGDATAAAAPQHTAGAAVTADHRPPALGRVSKNHGSTLTVVSPSATAGDRVSATVTAPLRGFPDGVTPRVGDLVGVTVDAVSGAAGAYPMCHWVTGVPKALPDGTLSVSGTRVLPSPQLRPGRAVSVCVLDTELPAAQVLAVRAPR
jgi:hypothetical protein